MRKRLYLFGILLIFLVEILGLIIFAFQTPEFEQDTIAVNEIMQSVKKDFNSLLEHINVTSFDYVVLDNDNKILYKTKSGLSESINCAIMHRDTILDIEIDNVVVGKVIIYNDDVKAFEEQKKTTILILAISIAVECGICLCYILYLRQRVVKPFHKLKGFAERVAGGNLDIPLEMDRHNLFGAFTESFDIMRSELKKARIAEAKANASKKELVAKLSHDIKTPVASIKAVAEVGQAVTKVEKDKKNYTQIINKADQINTLVTNLFTATLEELQQLTVTPTKIESTKIKTMLENADYLHYASIPNLPECLVVADELRLQQVFDNIFANSYKYAKTKIMVDVELKQNRLYIYIEDFGGGVKSEELPTLKEKYKRGSNTQNTEGAGLGLYISDYFMKEMYGQLDIKNGEHGLEVTLSLILNGI